MASLTQWTWVSANSGRQWRRGKPDTLQSMESQRVEHNLVTEQWTATSKFFWELESMYYDKDNLQRSELIIWWRDTGQKIYRKIKKPEKVNPVFKDAFVRKMFAKTVANLSFIFATLRGKDDRQASPESPWSMETDFIYIYNIQVSKATRILQGYTLRLGMNGCKSTFV